MAVNRKTSTGLYGDDLILFKGYINLAANYYQAEEFKPVPKPKLPVWEDVLWDPHG